MHDGGNSFTGSFSINLRMKFLKHSDTITAKFLDLMASNVIINLVKLDCEIKEKEERKLKKP